MEVVELRRGVFRDGVESKRDCVVTGEVEIERRGWRKLR